MMRLDFALQAAKGLCYLHGQNPPVVHRDLKSLNLLVSGDMTIKVADFGLSTMKVNTLLSESAAGTPVW